MYNDLISAKENLNDAKAFMRLTSAYYNRQLKDDKIIGNPVVVEFIDYYVYRINDWLYMYEKNQILPNQEALTAVIDDLDKVVQLINVYNEDTTNHILTLEYDDLKNALSIILENSKTDFTYESIYYEK